MRCGSRPSSGRRQLTRGCQPRRTNATAGHSSASAADALGRAQGDLDRDAAAHRVADEVGAVDVERVHQVDDGLGEPARGVGREAGLDEEPKPGRSIAWTR